MNLNRDFSDLFSALNAEGVHYLLVGGYAFSFHAVPRYTKDLDVWVEATPEMAPRTLRAQSEYGGIPIWVIGREDLRRNKLASGRKQDLLDLEKLGEN